MGRRTKARRTGGGYALRRPDDKDRPVTTMLTQDELQNALAEMESEDAAQRKLAGWLDAIGVTWCHVPNGGSRGKAEGGRFKAQGVKAGVPDILIFDPPPLDHPACPWHAPQPSPHPNHFTDSYCRDQVRGIAIELKRGDLKGRVSVEQGEWLVRLKDCGWLVYVAHGSAHALRWLEQLGFGR